jgi:hypothetical protein
VGNRLGGRGGGEIALGWSRVVGNRLGGRGGGEIALGVKPGGGESPWQTGRWAIALGRWGEEGKSPLGRSRADGKWALAVTPFQLTLRVAEPEGLARHLRFSANGVTAQGLGGRNDSDWSRQRGVM